MQAWKQGDKPLAELYGSQTTTLAKGAAQFPSGKAQADRYFNQNIKEAPERIKTAINQNISGIENYHATVDDLLSAGKARAAPKYEKAFSDVKEINNPRINEFLAQPELQTGLQRGLKIQRLESVAEGKAFNPSDYSITGFNEAGDPIIGNVPNMRLLDAGKRGLDAMIGEQTDAVTGKVTELGRALLKTKESYVNELKKANPYYADALESAGDYYKINNAMKSGKDFMRLDSEQVSRDFAKLGNNEKLAYKIGVGKELRDIIDNTTPGSNPYNRVFGKMEQQKRLASILSPSEYKNLERALKSEDRLFKMRNEVLGGSPTASKLEAMNQITSDAQDLIQSLPTGGTKATMIGAAKGVVKKIFGGLNDNSAEAVSRLLYETDPTNKVLLIEKMMGDKTLTNNEKLLIKDSYFKAEKYFKPKLEGAIGSSILGNEAIKEQDQ